MPVQIIRNDITKVECDAIVNAANKTLLGGGGVDGAIHKAAGPKLLAECIKLHGCKTGQAKITKGYNLPAKYVIHTVGPVWSGGNKNEKELLESCYMNSLELAKEYDCESVAFPLISAGVYGYHKEEALHVAIETISSFLLKNDMTVYIVVFDKKAFGLSEKLFSNIQAYIDDNYVDTHIDYRTENIRRPENNFFAPHASPSAPAPDFQLKPKAASASDVFFNNNNDACLCGAAVPSASLEYELGRLDESFSQMLLRKIDEEGMSDAQCYKKANIDRKLFSKIRSDVNYKPKKTTALAFAIALELSIEETKNMLMKAGYALSHSNKFDIIVEYFIKNGNYNIFEINEALFAFDQSLLG